MARSGVAFVGIFVGIDIEHATTSQDSNSRRAHSKLDGECDSGHVLLQLGVPPRGSLTEVQESTYEFVTPVRIS